MIKIILDKRIIRKSLVAILVFSFILSNNFVYIGALTKKAEAAINKEINYQGKLSDGSDNAVSDGTYEMEFKLYTVPTGGSAIWTETLSGVNEVEVTNGLFSVLLGNVSTLTGVDFNQTLYLGVNIENDGEMTPRKKLGAVPTAFVAESANSLQGLTASQFLRSDTANTSATINYASTTAITVSGTASTTDLVVSNGATIGNVTISNLNGPLQANAGLVSATTSIGVLYGGTGKTSISSSTILVGGPNNNFVEYATSSLGLAGISDLNSYLSLTNWYSTTTDQLTEGITNRYWSNDLFDNRLSATTTLPNLTTLLGLTDVIATRATTTNATTTSLYISGTISGAGLTSCSGSSDKLIWNALTQRFECGADAGAGGGITGLRGEYSAYQTGSSQTFATSSDTNILLTITSTGDTHTFTPLWTGLLSAARGGTGNSAPSYGNILVGNASGGYDLTATSSLGLPTFSYLFPSNATSTLLSFTGGLTSYASTTIGNGTQAGGLTISGGATTTGNAYFGGNVGVGVITPITSIHVANGVGTTNGSGGGRFGYLTSSGSWGAYTSYGSSNGYFAGTAFGISDTSPGAKLSVVGNAQIGFSSGQTAPANGLIVSGNVGIGTTSPYAKLSVSNFTTGTPGIVADALSGFTGNLLDLKVASTTKFSVNETGAITSAGFSSAGGVAVNSSGLLYNYSTSTWTFASSTLLGDSNTFTGNNLFLASTTIGAGTQITGLTISGGATTTGNAYFAGNVGIKTSSPSRTLEVQGDFLAQSGIYTNTSTLFLAGATVGSTNAAGLTVSASQPAGVLINASNASGIVTLSTGNGERMRITSTGNLGIGTTSPYAKLSITGSAGGTDSLFAISTSTSDFATTTAFQIDQNGNVSLLNGSKLTLDTSLNGPLQANAGLVSATTSIGVLYGGTGLTSAPSYGQLLLGNASGGYTLTATSSLGLPTFSYLFPSNATSTLLSFTGGLTSYASTTIGNGTQAGGLIISGGATTTGNAYFASKVGIGTTSPVANLGIQGSIGITTSQLYLAANGNVGINATNPQAKFQITAPDATTADQTALMLDTFAIQNGKLVKIAWASGNNAWQMGYIGAGFEGPDFGSFMTFATADIDGNEVQRLRIDQYGNVGIGTTSPYAKLSVSNFTTGTPGIVADALSGFTGNILDLKVASTTKFSVNETGAITSAGFSGAGGVAVNSSGLLYNYSTSTWTFASSTLLGDSNTFTGNNLFLASTTIGDGTQAGGLTISGNATTTGNAYFGGTLRIPLSSTASILGGTGSTGLAIENTNFFRWYTSGTERIRFNSSTIQAGVYAFNPTGSPGTTDTGLSRYASDIIAVGNGTAADVSGTLLVANIGVGTTSPYAKLSVSNFTTGTPGIVADALSGFTGNILDLKVASTTKFSVNETGAITSAGFSGAGGVAVNSSGLLYNYSTSTWTFASSTLLGDNNTWGGTNTFGALSSSALTLGSLNGPLQANAGLVSATTSIGVLYGGTGLTSIASSSLLVGNANGGFTAYATSSLGLGSVTSIATNNGLTGGTITNSGTIGLNTAGFLQNGLLTWDGSNLVATGTPNLTAGYFTATSSTASIFPYASTTALTVSGALYNSSLSDGCLNVTSGLVGSTGVACGTGAGGAFSWTPTTNYGVTVNATGTPIWFQNGLMASTTSYFAYASTTALTVSGIAYFPGSGIWDSSGNVGIGTTSPYAKLSVVGPVVAEYFHATSTTATSTFAGSVNIGSGAIVYDASTGTTSISYLETGNMNFGADSGVVSWIDMPVTSASANGVINSYTANLNGSPLLTIYGVSDGNGAVTNTAVGIGTTSPYAKLSVVGQVVASYFTATSSIASVFPYASSTALTVSGSLYNTSLSDGCLNVTSGLIGSTGSACATGGGSFSWTPTTFGSTVANSTSTLIGFTQGIYSLASSTIGDGTQIGGLTISGGATTTGNAYFGGNILGGTNFFWDNTNSRLGIGTTSPYAKLSVVGPVVAEYFHATSTTATSTIAGGLNVGNNGLTYDFTSGITSIASLTTGAFSFDTDAGLVSWADLPLSSAASGVPQGYSAQLNGSSTITVYGLSAGSGWLQNDWPRVSIGQTDAGTTTPTSKLTVFGNGTGTGGLFELVDYASTTRVKVLDNGNFGIGTTSPNWKLSVAGIGHFGDYVRSSYFTATSSTASVFPYASTTAFTVSGTAYFPGSGIWDSSGNVGIGTTSPYAKLSVVGPVVAEYFHATSTTATSTIAGGLNVGSGNLVYDFSTGITSASAFQVGNLNFDTDAGLVSWADLPLSSATDGTAEGYVAALNGSSTITVYGLSAGSGWLQNDWPRVSIGQTDAGTTTPTSKLTVFGNGTGTGGLFELVDNASSTRFKVLDNGNVGIATTSPWRTLSVVGTVAFNGLTSSATGNAVCITTGKDITDAGGGTCTPSSERFKENIITLAPGTALDQISKMRVVSFDYRAGAYSPEEASSSVGLIAEEVEKVNPILVDYGYDGKPLTLHFERITGLNVQAIQEQQKQISDLASTTNVLGIRNDQFATIFDNKLASSSQSTKTLSTALDLTNSSLLDVNSRLNQLLATTSILTLDLGNRMNVLEDQLSSLTASSTFLTALASSTANLLASSTADTLASSTPFLTRIFTAFTEFLSSTITRIKGIFVSELHVEDKLCVDDICVNKDQLKALLISAGGTSASSTPETTPSNSITPSVQNNPSTPLPIINTSNPVTTVSQPAVSSTTSSTDPSTTLATSTSPTTSGGSSGSSDGNSNGGSNGSEPVTPVATSTSPTSSPTPTPTPVTTTNSDNTTSTTDTTSTTPISDDSMTSPSTSDSTSVPTSSPTSEVVPAPTPEPAPEPTPEPAPTPSPTP